PRFVVTYRRPVIRPVPITPDKDGRRNKLQTAKATSRMIVSVLIPHSPLLARGASSIARRKRQAIIQIPAAARHVCRIPTGVVLRVDPSASAADGLLALRQRIRKDPRALPLNANLRHICPLKAHPVGE